MAVLIVLDASFWQKWKHNLNYFEQYLSSSRLDVTNKPFTIFCFQGTNVQMLYEENINPHAFFD